ncbi:MAG TPA: D-aminoacylase [Thermodesulfobacteriota bacterium]|nr:D-aminoacylase [Thermodesulfobacteriota bacterium]
MYDLIIQEGLIVDGTNCPGRKGDVGILKDRIVFMGELPRDQGKKILSAADKVVAPGFIDIHSHSDFTLLADPQAESKIYQGVTTELIGQCGVSAAPLEGAVRERRKAELTDLGVPLTWTKLNEYFLRLEEVPPIVNIATLVGHGNLRGSVVGYENRLTSRSELKKMKTLLGQSLNSGAFGLSTGLIYPPGVYSSIEELQVLTKVVAESGGLYATHLRSEGEGLVEAIQEALHIAETVGVSLQISHLKTHGRKNWGKLARVFQLIEDSQKKGFSIHADRYPYTASSTDLDVLLPSWAWEGGGQKELARLADPDSQKKMTEEILSQNPEPDFWKNVMIASVKKEKNRWMEGKTLAEISSQKKLAPWEALYDLLREEALGVSAIFFFMSEDNLNQILLKDYVMIGTDSSARSSSGILRRGKPHPRGFGTFPRILRHYTGKGKVLSLETAIHKMTGLPAKKLGLQDRGIIHPGYYADLVIFDPQTVCDRSDYANPFHYPVGIEHVFINGEEVISQGAVTGKRPGRILRK